MGLFGFGKSKEQKLAKQGVLIEYEDLAQVYMHLDEKEKEFEYHKKAAEQGNSWGIYCVGCCYDKGRGNGSRPEKGRRVV